MNELLRIGIWGVVAGIAFVILWRKGQIMRLRKYIEETREELRKCTWPTWEELKGSTVVITISIIILGGFTVGVDQILIRVFYLLKL